MIQGHESQSQVTATVGPTHTPIIRRIADNDKVSLEAVDHFSRLPRRTINRIFSFIPTNNDLLALARTSKLFYTVLVKNDEGICRRMITRHRVLKGSDAKFGFAQDLLEIYRLSDDVLDSEGT